MATTTKAMTSHINYFQMSKFLVQWKRREILCLARRV